MNWGRESKIERVVSRCGVVRRCATEVCYGRVVGMGAERQTHAPEPGTRRIASRLLLERKQDRSAEGKHEIEIVSLFRI